MRPALRSAGERVPGPSLLNTATMLSPRLRALRAAVTLVQGRCSSLQKRNQMERSEGWSASIRASSRTAAVPMALSLPPGQSIQLCESLWAMSRMISSGCVVPTFFA